MKFILLAALGWLVVLLWNYRVRRWWNRWDWMSSVYYRSLHWKRYRSRRLKLGNYKCQQCGRRWNKGIVILQVHHKHYQSLWRESMRDTNVLCSVCHAIKDDQKRQNWRKR